jgi:hypothetical protein
MQALTSAYLRGSVAPALLLVLLALAAGILGYFSVSRAADRPAAAVETQAPFIRGVIQSLTADELTLGSESGPIRVPLAPDAPVEVLRAIGTQQVTSGDWLNGGAVPHAQTLFALTGIVVIPQAQLEPPR